MREVPVDQIRDPVRQLCQDAATLLPDDVLQALKGARAAEESELGVIVLDQILENADLAARERLRRAPIVERPFSARTNTKNNTPPVVHTEIVPGDALRIKVMPKGGGCENMSRFTMFLPGAGNPASPGFVRKTVEGSGGTPCPPVIVGVGIGGTAEHSMYLAKRAITRRVGDPNADAETAGFEGGVRGKGNGLGLGPPAVGGRGDA